MGLEGLFGLWEERALHIVGRMAIFTDIRITMEVTLTLHAWCITMCMPCGMVFHGAVYYYP
jgi:hypothetical protein